MLVNGMVLEEEMKEAENHQTMWIVVTIVMKDNVIEVRRPTMLVNMTSLAQRGMAEAENHQIMQYIDEEMMEDSEDHPTTPIVVTIETVMEKVVNL